MKLFISIFLFANVLFVNAQCDFNIIDFNDLQINATQREMFVLKENQKTFTGDYVLFSMYTDGITNYLLVTFSRVAQKQFTEFCLNKNSYLKFDFKNKTSATISYNDVNLCKQQTKHPKRNDFNTLKTEFKLKLSPEVVKQLKANKVVQLTIYNNENDVFTYQIENKINDKNLDAVTYPSNYFIKTLSCLEF